MLNYFKKVSEKVMFHELNWTLKIGYNWLHILAGMLGFLFQCCGRCAKTHETLAHFRFTWKNRILKIHAVFFIVLNMQHSSLPYLQRHFILKCKLISDLIQSVLNIVLQALSKEYLRYSHKSRAGLIWQTYSISAASRTHK